MKKRYFTLLLGGLLIIGACQEENFDILTEETFPHEITEIEQKEDYVNLGLPNQEINNLELGEAIFAEGSNFKLYAISTGTVECLGEGMLLSGIFNRPPYPQFYLSLLVSKDLDVENIEVFGLTVFFLREYDGQEVGIMATGRTHTGNLPEIEINVLTDELIQGSIRAEIFKEPNIFNPTSEDGQSLGWITLEFSARLEKC